MTEVQKWNVAYITVAFLVLSIVLIGLEAEGII